MSRGQDDGTTILLGLKGYTTWSNGRKVYLEFHRRRWKCRDCKRTLAEGRELVWSRSKLTRQVEAEPLWQQITGYANQQRTVSICRCD